MTIMRKRIYSIISLLLVCSFLFATLIGCVATAGTPSTNTGKGTDADTTGSADTTGNADTTGSADTTGAVDTDTSQGTPGDDSDTTGTTQDDTTSTGTTQDDATSAGTTESNTTKAPDDTTTQKPAVTTKPEGDDKEPEVTHMLDGKKVIIIGNSYVYHGNCVITKSSKYPTQADRVNDLGYFYQICKANGATVNVTNWTFGGHSLGNIFDGECTYSDCPSNGKCHEDYITDRYYDYVLVSPGSGTVEQHIAEDFDYITKFFKEANPNVKIVCLGNLAAHGYSASGDLPGVYNYYKTLEQKGVIIADWGGLIYKILKDGYKVPNAKETYSLNTFVVKDGYHPNALSGYLTALMAYCAITGEKAEGQPYRFYNDTTLSSSFNMTKYISTNYINSNTNFTRVMYSAAEVTGLQQLVDKYLTEKPYLSTINKNDVDADTVMLDKNPTSSLISTVFSEEKQTANGWRATSSNWGLANTAGYKFFSGLRGDADAICSLEGATIANRLTDAQKKDLADIRYGLSIIGLSHMELTSYVIESSKTNNITSTSLLNLINGHFGSSYQSLLYFDSNKYNISGEQDSNGEYTALLTLNFGEKKTFDAIGYAAGSLKNIPQIQDVYVSDDGVNWTKVNSACYDTSVITLYNIQDRTTAKDPWNNNTPSYEVLFDMSDAQGKYIRIGIKHGANDAYDGMLARELLVFGE